MPAVLSNQRSNRWEQLYSTAIAGKTVLIIGFGRLGQAAGRAAKTLGLKIPQSILIRTDKVIE